MCYQLTTHMAPGCAEMLVFQSRAKPALFHVLGFQCWCGFWQLDCCPSVLLLPLLSFTLLLGMLQGFSPSNSSGCIHPSQFTDFGCHPYGRSMHSCRSIWCALLWQLLLLLSTDQVGLECCVKLASSRKPATEKLLQTSSIRSEISRKWGI